MVKWGPSPSQGGNTIKSLLIVSKDKDNITQKTGITYRYKCDRGCSVMISTEGNLQGPLEKCSRNTSGPLPSSKTMPTPHVIIPGWTTSLLCVGSYTTAQEPSWRSCTSGSIIHSSIGTLQSTSHPTNGMRSFSIPMTSISSSPFHNASCPLLMAYHLVGKGVGDSQFVSTFHNTG